jgi:hypothetical protein
VNPLNFLAELKRRNVYKVAIAYVVVAWLLIQAASIFFPAFDAPPWADKQSFFVRSRAREDLCESVAV